MMARIWTWLKNILATKPVEYAVVALGATLGVGLVAIVFIHVVVRGQQLNCGSGFFPQVQVCPSPQVDPLPVGTVVAYFGSDPVPEGWALCDGSEISGAGTSHSRLPNLIDRFIRGSNSPAETGRFAEGGRDVISVNHTHRWAYSEPEGEGTELFSFRQNNSIRKLVDWNNGIGDQGTGHYAVLLGKNMQLYTEHAGSEEESVLPRYVALRYICKAA